MSMNEWAKRGKEASPEVTIKKIQDIVADLGYDIICDEMEQQSLEDCFSCRIHLSGEGGENFASNGKGMTRQLSMASAHGELMERIQNRMFAMFPRRDDEKARELVLKDAPLYDPETGENEPECMTRLIERLAETVKMPPLFMSKEEVVRNFLKKLSYPSLEGKIPTTPYYSIRKDEIEYIPECYALFVGSNGLAAGNTYEEALIEGISELLERHSQSIIMDGNVIPPIIPRDYIAQYPHILKVIEDIEQSGRYKVRMLDCSLEKKLPVVCGLIIDTQTGKFGAKFGAQPNVAIAMERVFTEAMQGSKLQAFANRSYPDLGVEAGLKRKDKWNSMKVSYGSVASQLLMDTPTYEFKPWDSVEGKTNSEIMMSLIRLMEENGADIYVRDSGYLGFPSVNIYATGISEVRPVDELELKMDILWEKMTGYFKRIDTLTDEEVQEVKLYAQAKMGAMLENTIGAISQLYFKDAMPIIGCEAEFLFAACSYRLGNTEMAVNMFKNIANTIAGHEFISMENQMYAKAVYYYLAALQDGLDEQNAYDIAFNLCGELANKVRDQFKDRMLVLAKLYPVCHNQSALEITEGGCQYAIAHEFYRKLIEKENENPMTIDTMRRVFKKG